MARSNEGFTLIELSIVLVIIGLIIGGILTGQDLIDAAAQRAQISQIEKYNTAVHTFQGKYGFLPGDIPNPQATQFGFQSRGLYPGEGDGNGLIEGVNANGLGYKYGLFNIGGESPVVWVDLGTAGLIEGIFSTASTFNVPASVSSNAIKNWFPPAKIGGGNYIYVYYAPQNISRNNYWGVSAVTSMVQSTGLFSTPGFTVRQAYNIDSKMDDGLPQSGNVLSAYTNYTIATSVVWAAGGGVAGASSGGYATTNAVPYAITNCYDNNNTPSTPQTYSLSQNAGATNCALSFRFQ